MNLTSAELTLWDFYLPETLSNINDSLTTLSLQIEGSNFDFLEFLKRYKSLTTLNIFMGVKTFCQTNFLEVVTPVTTLESLTLDFTNQTSPLMEFLSLALLNLFSLYPNVKFQLLSNIPLCDDCLMSISK